MKGLRDKVAVVTGGSSGIGQAIAIRLGEEGARAAVRAFLAAQQPGVILYPSFETTWSSE